MFKVEVNKGSQVELRDVFSARLNKSFQFHEQVVYVHIPGEPHPIKTKCTLPKGKTDAYAEGIYTTSSSDVKVSPFGEITVKVSKLQPIGK